MLSVKENNTYNSHTQSAIVAKMKKGSHIWE